MRGRRWVEVGLGGVAFGAAAGCGGEAALVERATPPEPAASDPAEYAIIHDDTTRRLSVVSTLSASGTAELEAAGQGVPLPIPDGILIALDHSGTTYSTGGANATLTEVFIESGPTLRVGRSVSYADLVAGSDRGFFFQRISPTKTYIVGNVEPRLLVWNPMEMSIGKRFTLGLDIAAGYESRAVAAAVLRDGELWMITYSAASGGRAAHDLTLTRVDVESDEVISHAVDERCTGLGSVVLPNGDVYLSTALETARGNWPYSGSSVEPCALRLLAGATTLDPNWRASITDWVGSQLWGSTVLGSRGELLVRVAPEAAAAADPDGAFRAPIWQFWEIDPEGRSARPHGSLPSTAAYGFWLVDSQLYLRIPDPLDIESESPVVGETWIDTSDPASPVRGIHLPTRAAAVFRFR